VVIDATHADRHKELREQVVDHGLDVILDPATQAAATVGGYTEALGKLPWGLDRPHRVSDFEGRAGRERIARLGDFASSMASRSSWRRRISCIRTTLG
jgi:hypothetical protein